MVRTCTGEVWVRNSMREPSGFGLKKNVSCISRARMAFGEIQFCKVVVVGLDIGAFGDGKSHVGENRREFVHHLAERVNPACLPRAPRARAA